MTGPKLKVPLAERWRFLAGELEGHARHYQAGVSRKLELERDASGLRMHASDLDDSHLADRAPEVTELLQQCIRLRWSPSVVQALELWFTGTGFDTTTGEPRR